MSPERRDAAPSPEREAPLYARAARFSAQEPAGAAYLQAQELIRIAENGLSTYRFQLNQIWHVAVVGHPPPPQVDQQIERILAIGELTTLPRDLLAYLYRRRAAMIRGRIWTERHYRPGKKL